MLETKILLATIVRKFSFELVPGQNYVPDIAITMRWAIRLYLLLLDVFFVLDPGMECGCEYRHDEYLVVIYYSSIYNPENIL